ncbi:unnamed protein product [Lymnaea stagnalis]|uniref:Death domain-containing protein n=1 Tax=Lymnaea stagnalis TaxID=6523 RepID=A0AAV2HSV2_LYMST
MPPKKKYDGVDVKVRLEGDLEDRFVTLCEDWKVSQFLENITSLLLEEMKNQSYNVILTYDQLPPEVLEYEEEFGNRILSCKELVLQTKGQAYNRGVNRETQVETSIESTEKPYSWIYNLDDDVKNRQMKEKDVARIALCLDDLKMMTKFTLMTGLGFKKGEIEIAMSNSKGQDMDWCADLLFRWVYKNTSEATFRVLLEQMRIVEDLKPGTGDWEKIKKVVLLSGSSTNGK